MGPILSRLYINAFNVLQTYPEHIVNEQPSQQDASSADIIEVEQLNSIQGKSQTKQVIGYPMLRNTQRHVSIYAAQLKGFLMVD